MNTTPWTDSAPSPTRALGHLTWPGSVSFAILLAIVSGGSSQADSWLFWLFRLLCIGLFAAALLRLLGTRLSEIEKLSLMIAIAGVALAFLQLVPLPWGVFASLPGRDYVAKVFELAGIPPQSMPMTLSPGDTRGFILALLPPIAIFLATLTTEPRLRWLLVGAILLGCLSNVFLGLAQRFLGPTSNLYPYGFDNNGSATGFFSNRNNFAMLVCLSIPLTWALAQKLIRMRALSAPAAAAAGAVMMLIIFMGLAASNSRSGILLGMLALTLSALMVIFAPTTSRRGGAKLSLLAILGGVLVIGEFGMTGLLRLAESDPLTDFRSQMRAVTLRAASEYFPVGSGFGTFQSVYAMHETPATIIRAYVNHAHNDWLELWLEGGVPAAVLMGCFVALFLYQALRVWNPRGPYAEQVLPRAASVAALVLLLHSFVEFPLRMPSLACIFAAMIAMLLAAPATRMPKRSSGRSRPAPKGDEPQRPIIAAAPMAPPTFRVPRIDDDFRQREGAGGPTERLPPR